MANTDILEQLEQLKYFLATAPANWRSEQAIRKFMLPNGEYVSCILWNNLFHITGTDIVRCLVFRFQAFGRPVKNIKKFEEGIFSDLRNLKPGIDATLEEPRSEFLEMLYKNNCIRTQKKQKVFYWYSVPHDRLFMDALERDLKREALGAEPTTMLLNSHSPNSYPSSTSPPSTFHYPAMNMESRNESAVDASELVLDSHGAFSNMNREFRQQTRAEQDLMQAIDQSMDNWLSSGTCSDSRTLSLIDHLDTSGDLDSSTKNQVNYPVKQYTPDTPSSLSQGSNFFPTPEPVFSRYEDGNRTKSESGLGLDREELLLGAAFPNHELPLNHSDLQFPVDIFPSLPIGNSMNPVFNMLNGLEGSPSYKQRRKNLILNQGVWGNPYPSPYMNLTHHSADLTKEARSPHAKPAPYSRKVKGYDHLQRYGNAFTDAKPFACPMENCNQGFSQLDNFHQHLRVHADNTFPVSSPAPNTNLNELDFDDSNSPLLL
ncbi:hypothetical protein K7432_005253 [Basidiobolus ranarum]|uniref:C2H2-type domain-containing protein n=1 Tax=Basidiobolus ranarum TaxID=34480 RepID=A0ABR2WWZ9_9FUNG